MILKRDGRKVNFDKEKIVNAVLAAFKSVDGEFSKYAYLKANNIAEYIEAEHKDKDLSVEEIQDMVEKGLMSTMRKDVAKAYVLYREERTRERQRGTRLHQIITEKLMATNVQNQNANVDEYSFGGRKGEAGSELMKYIALNDVMSELARKNHLNNEIYQHDLDSYAVAMHNCLSIPFDDLLAKGFNTKQMDIRPAGSVNSAFQLVAVIFQVQSLNQFGGVSATHLDWTMVPYVRKSFFKHFRDGMKYLEGISFNAEYDPKEKPIESEGYKQFEKAYQYAMDMTERETQQAVEGLYHNLKY